MRKGEISIQTFFLIFMSIVMIGIIVFGFQRIFLVEDHISEQERIQIKNDLRKAIETCKDPLSSGNIETVKIRHKAFNGVCIIGSDSQTKSFFVDNNELNLISQTNNNSVVFLETVFTNQDYPDDFQVIDTFELDFDVTSQCFFDFENKGRVDVRIEC